MASGDYGIAMSRYLAVLFSDLERHTEVWHRLPRDQMVGVIAEYRYLAESLAGQYGCVYREWAGDGHMFLFESVDAAVRFGLQLVDSWSIASESLPTLSSLPHLSLRVGCHFGECTQLDGGEAWIGRGNAIAKRVESEADPDSVYVTATVLDLLDLPVYELEEAGTVSLTGDYAGARTLYRVVSFDQAALAAKPAEELSAEDWFLRAVSLIGTEQEWSEEEADCYREALRLRRDYPEAHMNYAVLLRNRGDQGEATRHYREALRLRPGYPEAHYNYASLLSARGSIAGAAEHYREALRLRPDYVDAHHGLANLLAARDEVEEAEVLYRETLRLRPDYVDARVNYAILLERRGDLEEAAEQYREALRLRPDAPVAHYNFALLLESRNDPAAAAAEYREAIRLWPEYGEAHNNLAVLLQLRGELDEAELHYRAALDARPDDPEAHYNYALLLRRRGDKDAAEQHLNTARELAPESPVFRSTLERPGAN
jgi:tetratricopeptide (TPR) repeat protein